MQDSRAVSYEGAATATDDWLPDGVVPLRVKSVIRETHDAISIVLDVPESSAQQFDYRAGQFVTLLVRVDGQQYQRCYSMSSTPTLGGDLRITVKRDRDGVVSNCLNDTAAPGQTIHAAPPRGRFVLKETDRPLIAFAGGSGITPVFSLLRSALASTTRDSRLFYANRNRDFVIFDAALAELRDRHPGRFALQHHLDETSGIVTPAQVETFIAHAGDADYYICGPGPFMDTVETTLRGAAVPAERVHLEPWRCRHRRGDHRVGSAHYNGGLLSGRYLAADGPHGGFACPFVVRSRFLRNMYGPRDRGLRPDDQPRRT
jgi:3-ketosteroid 9alpha-monooxygenase subunit B